MTAMEQRVKKEITTFAQLVLHTIPVTFLVKSTEIEVRTDTPPYLRGHGDSKHSAVIDMVHNAYLQGHGKAFLVNVQTRLAQDGPEAAEKLFELCTKALVSNNTRLNPTA